MQIPQTKPIHPERTQQDCQLGYYLALRRPSAETSLSLGTKALIFDTLTPSFQGEGGICADATASRPYLWIAQWPLTQHQHRRGGCRSAVKPLTQRSVFCVATGDCQVLILTGSAREEVKGTWKTIRTCGATK